LAIAIDKSTLTKDLFSDFYQILHGPLPDSSPLYNNEIEKYDFNFALAELKLDQAGWQKIEVKQSDLLAPELSPELKAISDYASSTKDVVDGAWRFKKDKKGNVSLLTVSLTAIDNGESLSVAQRVKGYWNAIGVRTNLNLVSSGEASGLVLSRNFETMLYSEIIGSNPDLFFFWHSSQIGNKGLNVSAYKNDRVDQLLEDVRLSTDSTVKNSNYKEIQQIINSEAPAIFLYENSYTYVQSKKLKGFSNTSINDPSDRFSGISSWYLKTKNKFSF
jgi:peptide/nickel transport system substrate-binding protein